MASYLRDLLNAGVYLNYGLGSSTTDSSVRPAKTGLNSEIDVLGTKQIIQKYFNPSSFNSNLCSVFVVWIGYNDYWFGSTPVPVNRENKILKILDMLYNMKARLFLIPSIAPLGDNPGMWNSINRNRYNNDSTIHNSLLPVRLQEWQAQRSGSKVIFVNFTDAFGDQSTLIRNVSCLSGGYMTKNAKICSQPINYMYYDYYHPTSPFGEALANIAYNTLSQNI
eukprot:NODE_5802_length_966_cov_35.085409_g5219_i0.p1 GENE.NODE_5802_length_966_cov_35.085409_g5219_i0~~NODE_5802_length_966_cov_35.085409_g5219_i0.p1  ORF type:complete len:223 (+),score=25.46 NODE_5802_length_966_cov_35.085409_g5219_i0:192-860(+)